MDSHIQRHLKAEEFYQEIIALIPEEVIKAAGGETPIRGKLDAILTLGKIDGRLSALGERVPAAGERWIPRDDPEDSVEIKSVETVPAVHYRSTGTGHRPAQTHMSCRVADFLKWHTPVTDSAPDQLIEGWTRIVEAS
jgi:hypothetical protein